MNLRLIRQLVSTRDLRNIAVGFVVVFGGLGLAVLTLVAHNDGDVRLAGIAAGLSLLFVLLLLIFVVPPLARNASREASQMNLPFEFTTGGAVMIVLVLVVGFSAWNTGNNLLFIVLSFMLSTMIVGFLAGRTMLKKLDVKVRFPETIFAGEAVPIVVQLVNRKRLFPSFSVIVEIRGREREDVADAELIRTALPEFIAKRLTRASIVSRTLEHVVYVPRRGTDETTVDYIFPERGRFTIKDFELSTGFPFGFFRHRRRLAAREAEIFIFPAITAFDSTVDHVPLTGNRVAAAKRGVGSDLMSLREYTHDDDLRRVDWKATARTQRLTVREFAADSELRVTVALDTVLSTSETPPKPPGDDSPHNSRFEHGVSLAASALVQLADDQTEFRLAVGDQITEMGSGRGHLAHCLSILAVTDPAKTTEPHDTLQRISAVDEADTVLFFTGNDGAEADAAMPQTLKIIRF